MTCHELASLLAERRPELDAGDIARLCVLIFSTCEDPSELADEKKLMAAWTNASFRLESASDQYAAVSSDLDAICSGGPIQFTPDQLWTLLRAVKVQSRLLELYTDQPALA